MALIEVSTFSPSLDLNVDFNVIIPNDLKKGEKINVLFLLHGYQGYHKDWTRSSNIERYASKYRIAVVMPGVNNSYYNNMAHGFNYFDYINNDLPKLIEGMFNLTLSRENTYIAGLSMGGYGALKSAFTYPNRFRGVASLSGAVNIESIIETNKAPVRKKLMEGSFGLERKAEDDINLFKLTSNENVKSLDIFITCGTDDFLYEDNLAFEKHLKDKKIDAKFIFDDGNHNWDYWDRNIQLVLEHFFGK